MGMRSCWWRRQALCAHRAEHACRRKFGTQATIRRPQPLHRAVMLIFAARSPARPQAASQIGEGLTPCGVDVARHHEQCGGSRKGRVTAGAGVEPHREQIIPAPGRVCINTNTRGSADGSPRASGRPAHPRRGPNASRRIVCRGLYVTEPRRFIGGRRGDPASSRFRGRPGRDGRRQAASVPQAPKSGRDRTEPTRRRFYAREQTRPT